MKTIFATISAALGLALASPLLMAAKQLTSGPYKVSVVELYTSEGCSSCPPADAFLSKLGEIREADEIVPLAFHVDYWDYIGWKDPYAQAAFSQRQRELASINRQRTIYTPEFIVDGEVVRGSQHIIRQVKGTQKQQAEADIELNLSDVVEHNFTMEVTIENIEFQGDDRPQVYVAIYESGLSSKINAGENRGRKLNHDYVVRYLSTPQDTASGKTHHYKLSLDPAWKQSALGVAAVVMLQNSGQTLQALKSTL